MATKIISLSSDTNVDDDYIDMELSSSSNFICYSINSPPQSREFEFQMGSVSIDKETTTSPADELFYKGKLLPLHLPPRLQMVQNLLQDPNATEMQFEDRNSCDIGSSTAPSTNTNTPLESCNISPSESCRVSSELNPDECFFEWSTELNSFIRDDQQKKPWTKKIKKSSLSQKLKASSAYIKSLFSKSGCTDESAAKPASNVETESKELKYMKIPKKKPIGKNIYSERSKLPTSTNTLFKNIDREMAEDCNFSLQKRRSFSGAIQWHSTIKFSSFSSVSSSGSSSTSSSSSSSSFSFGSNGFNDLLFLKRSSSANSEIDNSIEGAIAHCKQSQLQFTSRKTPSHELGVCSFSASQNAASRDQQRPKLCIV